MDNEFELDPDLRAEAAQIRKAIEFWFASKGDRPAPRREQFSLRATLGFAPHLQILEILDGGRSYRQRLTGTAITAQLRDDPTGRTFHADSADPIVQRMLKALNWVLENRKPLRTVARRTALPGQDFVRHETVFLPLSSDGESIDLVAVVSSFAPVAKSAPDQ